MSSNGQGNQQPRLTYINLLKGYYLMESPSRVGAKANSLFLWLLHKANELGYPKVLSLPNSVVMSGAGLENPSALHTSRKVLLSTFFGHSKLVSYRKPVHSSQCGGYTINYDLLLDNLPLGFNSQSQSLVNLDSIASQSLPYKKNKEEEEKEESPKGDNMKYKKIVNLIIKACPSWYPSNDLIIDRVNDLVAEYPEHQIKEVIINAGRKGVKSSSFLTYVEGGLRSFEKFYGAKQKKLNGAKTDERASAIKRGKQMVLILQSDDKVMKNQAKIQLGALERYYQEYGEEEYGDAIGLEHRKFQRFIKGEDRQ